MGIEGAGIQAGVEHPGSKACQMDLSDILEPLCKGVATIRHRRLIRVECGGEDIGTFQRIQARLGQIVIHGAGADQGRVRFGEDIQRLHPLVFTLNTRQDPVGF